jgi:four helix bundle protein
MLVIQTIAVEMIRELRGPIVEIEKADRDLGKQLRRAAASVVLNLAEGSGSTGGTRRERYRTALGSLSEVEACLSVGVAFGYISGGTDGVMSRARQVAKGLRKLT